MKRIFLLSIGYLLIQSVVAQNEIAMPVISTEFRASSEKINDLVHTKLDVKFDYQKSYLYGKAWISLKPHFYPTDSLRLDAKGMNINQVAIVKNGKNSLLKYSYDSLHLNIKLDKMYKSSEQYIIYIDYTAKPDEFNAKGSAAITDAKGLYFINPRGEVKDKPTQIWTQGETEASSVWFPTIDKPNQKTTEEIYMTVPAKYVTLSNGNMVSQKNNADGTRTDYWKMDQPHSPYLFFMGVGDFAVIKDSYKGKEVAYYVEKEYAPVARKIFGKTPDMIALFSRLTGVDYPWAKYDQIVGRDYVSGAMENTTATLHQQSAQQDARQLVDNNAWEEVIAHELFHQWFGDYVTTESWSNITLNESFATIGSQLWNEYNYGKDEGNAERYKSAQDYLNSNSERKNLVRFNYNEQEEVFDAVSYNKGGAILQMLRNYVGDSAFFKSLNLYLNTNKYKNAEAQNLRLAFEEVTGKDLNWFWNQWYYGSGHPVLDINYSYNNANKTAGVIVRQTQTGGKLFKMPVAIDVYTGANKQRFNVWTQNATDTFYFPAAAKPDLINFDGDKILLAQKKENKTLDEYYNQYKFAANYIDRREAIDSAEKRQDQARALDILKLGLQDRFYGIREYAIEKLDVKRADVKTMAEPILADLAKNDARRTVRAAAISQLGEYKQTKYLSLFQSAVNDSSYSVSGSALAAISQIDTALAFREAKRLVQTQVKGKLGQVVYMSIIQNGTDSEAEKVLTYFEGLSMQQKLEMIAPIIEFLGKSKEPVFFKRGLDDVTTLVQDVPKEYRQQVLGFVEPMFIGLQKAKTAQGQQELATYVENKLSEVKK